MLDVTRLASFEASASPTSSLERRLLDIDGARRSSCLHLAQAAPADTASDAANIVTTSIENDRYDAWTMTIQDFGAGLATNEGLAIWDRAVSTAARRESRIASVLDEKEREELHRLLRTVMRAFPPIAHHAPAAPEEE